MYNKLIILPIVSLTKIEKKLIILSWQTKINKRVSKSYCWLDFECVMAFKLCKVWTFTRKNFKHYRILETDSW